MTFGLKTSTVKLLKRFNRSFPQFYEQFVSSDIQLQNLRLAYQLYQTKEAVIELKSESSKSVLYFAYRNQSFLLSDIFGVLAAYGLTIHSLSLYGQIHSPMLVFIKLVISRGGKSLPQKTAENVRKAIKETLLGRFDECDLARGFVSSECQFASLARTHTFDFVFVGTKRKFNS